MPYYSEVNVWLFYLSDMSHSRLSMSDALKNGWKASKPASATTFASQRNFTQLQTEKEAGPLLASHLSYAVQ